MKNYYFWFCTGSQDLYGDECLRKVADHSAKIVEGLNASGNLPFPVVLKPTLISQASIRQTFHDANNDPECAGVITWMHTFSPAKMWIHGLQALNKPLLHLHTQYNKEIPWDSIDMDFMNLNQSAHGDREFGHICSRLRKPRKVVVGYWKERQTQEHIAVWARVAAAVADAKDMLIIRFGDQMNNVAVTDGDKVSAEQVLGYHVDYCCVSELMDYWKKVNPSDVDALVEEYHKLYKIVPCEAGAEIGEKKIWNAARAELALRAILKAKGAKGFTTNFDDLGSWDDPDSEGFVGFDQIPGLASQRLMAEGYGFGAEGDWKSAALYRTLWYMTQGLPTGCSFLEDYTLNFDGANSSLLQSHMLEICPLIAVADEPVRLEVHHLGIGVRKQQTARLVFNSKVGDGVTATVVDMGNRFRLIVNDVHCIKPKPLPKLPVANALWIPQPNFEIGAGAWILAGGTHHSCFSYDITPEYWEDYAEMLGIEYLHIDKNSTFESVKRDLRINEVYYMLNKALM